MCVLVRNGFSVGCEGGLQTEKAILRMVIAVGKKLLLWPVVLL